jgi:hypothetical protein
MEQLKLLSMIHTFLRKGELVTSRWRRVFLPFRCLLTILPGELVDGHSHL